MIDDFFELEISRVDAVTPSHQSYIYGRFHLFIRQDVGTVEIRENGYTLDDEAIDIIRNFVIANKKKYKKTIKKKEKNLDQGKSISFMSILNNNIYCVTNYANDRKFEVFEKKIIDKIEIIVNQCIANGSIYNDESSPNPLKKLENWKSGYDIGQEKNLERKINFFKSKIKFREDLLVKLKNSKIDDKLFEECFEEVVADPRLYLNYQNYVIKTLANRNPLKAQELSLDEIGRQFVFFRRAHYMTGGYGEVIDEEEKKVFIELMERYCSLKDEETQKKLEKLEAELGTLRKLREDKK